MSWRPAPAGAAGADELVDLMAYQELLCHAGELGGELWRQGGDEGGQPT